MLSLNRDIIEQMSELDDRHTRRMEPLFLGDYLLSATLEHRVPGFSDFCGEINSYSNTFLYYSLHYTTQFVIFRPKSQAVSQLICSKVDAII